MNGKGKNVYSTFEKDVNTQPGQLSHLTDHLLPHKTINTRKKEREPALRRLCIVFTYHCFPQGIRYRGRLQWLWWQWLWWFLPFCCLLVCLTQTQPFIALRGILCFYLDQTMHVFTLAWSFFPLFVFCLSFFLSLSLFPSLRSSFCFFLSCPRAEVVVGAAAKGKREQSLLSPKTSLSLGPQVNSCLWTNMLFGIWD